MIKSFFNKKTLKKIIENESETKIIKNFLNTNEIKKLVEIEKNSKYLVDREDGRKRSLATKGNLVSRNNDSWHPEIKKILIPKLKKIFKKEQIHVAKNEFPPHFFYTKNPTRLHADTGRIKDSIVNKQILIPLKISPSNKPVRTIIFKNRWFGQASFFQYNKEDKVNKKYYITNNDKKFVEINDLKKFYNFIKNTKGVVDYDNNKFKIDTKFINKIKKILSIKRYNQITNLHLNKKKKFDKNLYKKYLTHQPIKDYYGLEVDVNYKWKLGDLLIWDRTRIHTSDNYLLNGAKKKNGFRNFFLNKE